MTKDNVWKVLGALAAFAALVTFSILYTNHVQRVSDRRWCELIPSLDDRYQSLDTKDPDAIRFRDQVHRINESLPCTK
jgi:hypothetical protein